MISAKRMVDYSDHDVRRVRTADDAAGSPLLVPAGRDLGRLRETRR
jgi:hypothetical protein